MRHKYITRIDSGSTHCYWVRIGFGIPEKVQKSFPDLRHGGKQEAHKLALTWRNQQLKVLQPLMNKAYAYDINKQRHWGVGVCESWNRDRNGWDYLHIRAQYWNGLKKKQVNKQFSVNKYGYDKAMLLAKQWRKFKLTGEL